MLRWRPSPAFVLAFVALLVALGGSAPAAPVREAAKKLVTGKQIKDSSITGKDVKNSSITGKDVKNRSLTPKDFKGSVRGPKGATGATGAPGATGSQGVSGVSKVTRLEVIPSTVSSGLDINYQLLRDVGTFTKASATSRIKLSWNGRNEGAGTGAWFCDFQLRIDAGQPTGGGGRSVVQPGATGPGQEPASSVAFFDGFAAGTREVDIYVRGNMATSCSTALLGYEDEIFVEEMPT